MSGSQSCPCCHTAKSFPGYRMFNPACLHCGARIIQSLGALAIGPSERRTRRQAVLAEWVAHGHSETQIRELAKGPSALAPSPGKAAASTPLSSE